jgi:hypothetical protein
MERRLSGRGTGLIAGHCVGFIPAGRALLGLAVQVRDDAARLVLPDR